MNPDTPDTLDLTLFVACYNEEQNIEGTLDEVFAALDQGTLSHEVIVVDDASKDRSVERIKAYMERHPDRPVRLVERKRNVGLAQNFVDMAFVGRGKYYRLVCGDNVEPREALAFIFKHIGAADLVIPYHKVPLEGRTWLRHRISSTYTFLVNLLSGYSLHYYNGLAIYKRYDVLRWHSYAHGFGFQADMVTRLLDQGTSYIQIPVTLHDRVHGTSTALTLKNLLSVAHTLLDITVRRLAKILYGRGQKPVRIDYLGEMEEENTRR